MRHYQTEEFLFNSTPNSLEVEVEKTISVLYDLCVLMRKKGKSNDPREDALRKILLSRKTIISMHNVAHDLKVGNIGLNTLLRKNGYIIN